jgi:hypothetical protein
VLEQHAEHFGEGDLADFASCAEEGGARARGEVDVAFAGTGWVDGFVGRCLESCIIEVSRLLLFDLNSTWREEEGLTETTLMESPG